MSCAANLHRLEHVVPTSTSKIQRMALEPVSLCRYSGDKPHVGVAGVTLHQRYRAPPACCPMPLNASMPRPAFPALTPTINSSVDWGSYVAITKLKCDVRNQEDYLGGACVLVTKKD